jgi:hypothetical protein
MSRFWKQGIALVALAAAMGLLCLSPSLAARPGGGGTTGPSYQIVELDSAGGLFEGYPFDINNAGLIVGGGTGSAACWTVTKTDTTVTTTLHLLDGEGAFGVNDAGEIVGSSNETAAYWENRNAAPQPLPVPMGSTRSIAEAINSTGVICGWAEFSDAGGQRSQVALVWRVTAEGIWGPLVLPALAPLDSTAAFAVNDNDAHDAALVVGQEWESSTGVGAGLAWSVTSLPDGSLTVDPVPDVLDAQASGTGVNDSGVICGYVYPDAVVWDGTSKRILDRSATISAFGGRKACNSANAYAINAGGVIVGRGSFAPYSKAVVWPSASAAMILLDKFLNKNVRFTELNSASAVNDAGEIVGSGWDNNRSFHPAYLAIPK